MRTKVYINFKDILNATKGIDKVLYFDLNFIETKVKEKISIKVTITIK